MADRFWTAPTSGTLAAGAAGSGDSVDTMPPYPGWALTSLEGAPDAVVGPATRYVYNVLKYGAHWDTVDEAACAHPDVVLLQLLHADGLVARDLVARARAAVQHAKTLTDGSCPKRDHLYLDAYSAWVLEGDVAKSAHYFASAAAMCPADIFALKRSQSMFFAAGDARSMLEVALSPAIFTAQTGKPFYHGMLSFAYEQNVKMAEAEEEGRRGTLIQADDAWAHHAVVHTLYLSGRLREGLDFMLPLAHYWKGLCSFMITHNWWHIALLHMDMCNFEKVTELYDSDVWGVDPEDIEDQFGALGLLLKWELRCRTMAAIGQPIADEYGIPAVHKRRADVVSHSKSKLAGHYYGLSDCVMLHAAAAAGLTEQVQDEVERFCKDTDTWPESRKATAQAWKTAVQASVAFAMGDVTTATAKFDEMGSSWSLLSGSSEQRDVVHEMHVDAAIEAGKLDEARIMLEARAAERPTIPATYYLLALVEQRAGNTEQRAARLAEAAKWKAFHATSTATTA